MGMETEMEMEMGMEMGRGVRLATKPSISGLGE